MIFMQGKRRNHINLCTHIRELFLYKDGLFNNRNVNFEQHQSINFLKYQTEQATFFSFGGWCSDEGSRLLPTLPRFNSGPVP